MFNEKSAEWSVKQGKEIPVWQSPKYQESKQKAIEIINSGKYGLTEADFWILMNETKSGKMGYTGLIMSHNGCLKVNGTLENEKRFRPECVHVDKDGWGNSLVCYYECPEQGLFEVGEVSAKNCKNDYPYAMAVKRLFDRVVLKNSKLAYSGIYGEDEADEFRNPMNETETSKPATSTAPKPEPPKLTCDNCSKVIIGYTNSRNRFVPPEELIKTTQLRFKKTLCLECAKSMSAKEKDDG